MKLYDDPAFAHLDPRLVVHLQHLIDTSAIMTTKSPAAANFWCCDLIVERRESLMETIDYKFLDEVLEKHDSDGTKIIPIMQQVQEKYRYLPKEALTYIAKKTGLSEAKLYGVATFYSNFSLEGKGKYVLKVCRGTACHVRKSANVLNALYEATGLSDSKSTTDDGLISIEIVSCLGACALSPVVMVNDVVHAAMTPDKAKDLVAELRAEG